MTKVLLDDSYNSDLITVTGPEKLTFREVVGIIAKASSREIEFQAISIEEYGEAMKEVGLPDAYIWLFTYLFREVLGNDENQTISHDVEKVLDRKATSFEAFAKKTAQTGVWNQQ